MCSAHLPARVGNLATSLANCIITTPVSTAVLRGLCLVVVGDHDHALDDDKGSSKMGVAGYAAAYP